MLKLKRKTNPENQHVQLSVRKPYRKVIEIYSEATGYTISSIIETAIEEFFPQIDWDEIIPNDTHVEFDKQYQI